MISRGAGGIEFFNIAMDASVLAQVAAVTLAAGVLSGLMPAIIETRRLQTNPLRAMAGAERARQRWRDALVVLEVAITVALLVETASIVDAYGRAMTADLGFSTRPFIGVNLHHPDGVPVEDVLRAVRRVPGIASAEAASDIPYSGLGTRIRVSTQSDGSNPQGAVRMSIGPSFFSTLGVPIRSGRAFGDSDTPEARVAIVNQLLDSRLFPPHQALSRQIWIDGLAYDVVGTVADYSSNPLRPEWTEPKVFLPLPATRAELPAVNLLVRTIDDPGPSVQTVRRELRRAVPGIDVRRAYALSSIRDVMAHEMVLGTAPLFPLVLIGMLLTAAGIYGVLAFAVTRRARELAVRVAVGATRRDVTRLITGHTSRLVTIGTVLGVGVTFGLSRLVRAAGGAGSILDPALLAFVVPILLLVAIAILASWFPARRALRINPTVVLRAT
jgi:hypothetical protein